MFTYYICKITFWTHQYCITVIVLCFCDIDTCRNGCVKWKRGKDTTFNNSEAVAQSCKFHFIFKLNVVWISLSLLTF